MEKRDQLAESLRWGASAAYAMTILYAAVCLSSSLPIARQNGRPVRLRSTPHPVLADAQGITTSASTPIVRLKQPLAWELAEPFLSGPAKPTLSPTFRICCHTSAFSICRPPKTVAHLTDRRSIVQIHVCKGIDEYV